MASYQDIQPEYLARLFENDIKHRVSLILYEAMKGAVDQAVNEAVENIKANIQSWRAYDRFGDDIRITLEDKRTK